MTTPATPAAGEAVTDIAGVDAKLVALIEGMSRADRSKLRQLLDLPEIDWAAVGARLRLAAAALDIPPAEVEAVARLADHLLNEGPGFIAFCRRHRINLDWVVTGDPTTLLRESVAAREAIDGISDRLQALATAAGV